MNDICFYCKTKSRATEKLGQKELEKLGDNCNQASFQKGDKIIVEKSMSENIVFVIEGLVKIHTLGPHKEQILKLVKGPSYLGIPTAFGAKTNEYSATAVTDVKICFIEFGVFKNLIQENGEFALEIITDLCESEIQSYKKYINQVQKQGPGKIAEALLFFSEKIFKSDHFILPLTRSELGDLTCTTRETISRILSDFSKNNIILINRGDVTILNKDLLKNISKTG